MFLLNRRYNFFIFTAAVFFFLISAPAYYYYFFVSFWGLLFRFHIQKKKRVMLSSSFCLEDNITSLEVLELLCKTDPQLRGAIAAQRLRGAKIPKTPLAVFWLTGLLFRFIAGVPFLIFKRVALFCRVVTHLQNYEGPRPDN